MNKLPEFKPLPEVDNLRSNYMSAFNHGMNIYEALVYLQGYVKITYNSMDELIDDWNNFEQYVTENISKIANEKTQEILNQWKSDGTLNEIIAQNPLWNQKVNKAGDVMSGDLQFQEDTGVYGTLHSGTKVNMISHSYTGTDDYTQIGDDNAQAVIHSEKRPVWYDGSKNQDLLVEEDLNTTKSDIREIQDKIETGAYFTNDVGGQPTITNYQENKNVSIIQPSDVVNNLNSTETNKPLSANQGKILNKYILNADNVVELWTGSTESNPNTVTLSDRYTNYRALIFKHTDKNYLCWVDITKEKVTGKLVGFSWDGLNIPVVCVIDMNSNTSGNTLKFSLQRSNWQGQILNNRVTAIYGVKRVGD